jgi:hypothetical protein
VSGAAVPRAVFVYPAEPHARRHGPRGYLEYQSFKPWLRDEFSFRCVYCLSRERWYPNGADSFSVDHVVPQHAAPDRVCDYENLVYACVRCNSCKQDGLLPDPCATGFARLLRVREEDGVVEGLTPEGARLIEVLVLNHPRAVDWRNRWQAALRRVQAAARDGDPDLLRWMMGFPDDLPDLAALRPPGNTRPGGVAQSHLALRQQRALAEVY